MKLTHDDLIIRYQVTPRCVQLKRFDQLFPDGLDVTEDSCIAIAGEFAWWEVSAALLKPSFYRHYISRVNDEHFNLMAFRRYLLNQHCHEDLLSNDRRDEVKRLVAHRLSHIEARLFARLFQEQKP